jgi:prepilin-type N-terminal cleavage/methylation domain-containing protein
MAMIFRRLRLINRNQIGFTLIELMIAIAITGVVTGAVTTTIFQVANGSARTNNHMTAVREVRSAGYWVSHDAFMTKSVELADESVDDPDGTRFPFTLTWTDWETNEVHLVVYNIVGDELQRVHSINGTTDTSIVVAEFIDTTLDDDGQRKTRVDGELTLTVTATLGAGSQEQSETRTYEIVPRPGS